MEIQLSRDERRRLEEYAEALGLSLEQALIHAAGEEIERRYRLPAREASVVPIKGLIRDRHDP